MAGRELDAKVAERLGCEVAWYAVFAETIHPTCKCKDRRHNLDHPAIAGEIKPYSTSIAAALGEPLAELKRRGWRVVICYEPDDEEDEVNLRKSDTDDWVISLGPIPEAICLAFIKATDPNAHPHPL